MTAKSRSKEKPPCSVEDCLEPSRCKGYCQMHYQRYKRHGNPLTVLSTSWKRDRFEFKHKNATENSEKYSYQDLCCLADIFPFLYDEEYMSQFKID